MATRARWRCRFEVGTVKFRTLFDFTRHQMNVGCVCGSCAHQGVVHCDRLARWCFLKRLHGTVDALPGFLRCSHCGGRPMRIRPTPLPPTFPDWGADEAAWKRMQRRLRG